jgi:hypothetical protein
VLALKLIEERTGSIMRHLAPLLFLLLLIERGANALLHTTTRTLSSRRFLSTVPDDTEKSELDKGYEQLYDCYIQCTFSGFNGLRDMPCNIELQKEFKVKFSGGLDSPEPGFWRAIRLDNGNDIIEATQPVFAEYMFYLDLWEKTLMWKGIPFTLSDVHVPLSFLFSLLILHSHTLFTHTHRVH